MSVISIIVNIIQNLFIFPSYSSLHYCHGRRERDSTAKVLLFVLARPNIPHVLCVKVQANHRFFFHYSILKNQGLSVFVDLLAVTHVNYDDDTSIAANAISTP